MIFADGKGGKMEQVEKWFRVHKKACLVTGIMGLLLAPFLWPVFLAVIVQSLTIGLPIAAGICCYKYLNEKKEKTNENEQKCHHAETKESAPSEVCEHAEASGSIPKSPDETRTEPVNTKEEPELISQEALLWYEKEGKERLAAIRKKAGYEKKTELAVNKDGICTVPGKNGHHRIGFLKGYAGRPRETLVKLLKDDGYTVRSSGSYLWISWK